MNRYPVIGLLGGTFDPIHNGHMHLAQEAYRMLQLDAIHFIPAAQPLLRESPVAEATMRLEMVRLATEPYAYFKVDDREVKRGGHSYTIETLEAIRADLPQVALCLMIGIDQFANFNQWERWQEIPNFAHVVVNSRTGFEGVLPSEINDFYKTYSAKDVEDLQSTTQGKILSLQLETLPISSTLIREKIKRNEDVCSLLPKKVWEYIRQKKLYGSS